MPKGADFEIQRNGQGEPITVIEALAINEKRGRCIECAEPGKAHRGSRQGAQAAHFEHDKRNPECSRSDHRTG